MGRAPRPLLLSSWGDVGDGTACHPSIWEGEAERRQVDRQEDWGREPPRPGPPGGGGCGQGPPCLGGVRNRGSRDGGVKSTARLFQVAGTQRPAGRRLALLPPPQPPQNSQKSGQGLEAD